MAASDPGCAKTRKIKITFFSSSSKLRKLASLTATLTDGYDAHTQRGLLRPYRRAYVQLHLAGRRDEM